MPTYPLVKFMASPATTAAVRYDFNTAISGGGRAHILHGAWDLGAPELQGDSDGIDVEWGLRTIQFTQRIEGSEADALAKQSALARELLRRSNWLMVQIAADREPVWFQTYRGDPGSLSFENVRLDSTGFDAWDIGLSLQAEPFALGARVTLSPITVNNDPAAGSNPCRAVLPTILGDAPAPLRIVSDTGLDGRRLMYALHASESTPSAIVWQIGSSDGNTAVTDTGAGVANAAYSGGSYRAVTFATQAGLTVRLALANKTFTAGRYKVLARIARSDTDSEFDVMFAYTASAPVTISGEHVHWGPNGPSTSAGHAAWVDLGDFTFPAGYQRPDGSPLETVTSAGSLSLSRTTGAGSAHLDAVMLVPVEVSDTLDNNILYTYFPATGIGSGSGTWDGDSEMLWLLSSGSAPVPLSAEIKGGYPVATPGAVNLLTVLQQVNGARSSANVDGSDGITVAASLTISYQPRWLWIGDG